MKKLTALLMMLGSLSFVSLPTLAAEAEGTIDEVRVCATGRSDWKHFTFFKLSDGSWFHLFTNYTVSSGHDDNASHSVVMTAYVSRLKVKAKMSSPGETHCGITSLGSFNTVAGDYIAITEYSQP